MKTFKIWARPKKNLGLYKISHEGLWNKTPGVYDRTVEADSKEDAQKAFKNTYFGKHCVIEHIEEV